MADIELKTYGDLKNAINSISLKQKGDKIVSQGKSFALDQVLGFFPGASNAKTLYDFIKAATLRPDDKKTKTWLDKLDIDDDVSAIVDDTVENGFLKYISDRIKSKNDNDSLENDFNMNQELASYLSDKYNKRYVAGVPNSNVNEMDKKTKIKETLKTKLKQEMSVTGTGASVTPGVGAGVATKYAFGKRDNKGTPKDWKAAPSVPNRPSKAMDYKELWEIERDQEVKITSGQYAGNTAIVHDFDSEKDNVSGDDWVDVLIGSKKEKKTVKASELKPLKEMDAQNSNTDEILTYLQAAKQNGTLSPDAQEVFLQWMNTPGASREEIIKVLRKLTGMYLKEGYAQFRNSTKQRSKPDQFHQAVKQVKQKMNEINRIFEYVDRLKSELSEGEDLKYKKYTENAFTQIKESAKQLFLKSTKLK
jgi:transcription antitermination factor NusG